MAEDSRWPSFEQLKHISGKKRPGSAPRKHDRFIRLLDILTVLSNYHEDGVSVSELAARHEVSTKTI